MSDTPPDKPSDNPGVIAPPPLIFAGGFIVALILHTLMRGSSTYLPTWLLFILAAVCLILGIIFLIGAIGLFRDAGTNARPWKPTTAIVSTGVYGFSRNPMYLGMALIYLAMALGTDNGIALIVLIPVIYVMTRFVIQREERYLEAKFGAEYLAYKSEVRRWI